MLKMQAGDDMEPSNQTAERESGRLLIEARDLTKNFAGPGGREIAALGPLDLRVHAGEFVCVVGPSGCGKSTLLRLIAGLDLPSDGELQLAEPRDAGRPFNSMVFQGDSTFPWMTVHGNVEYGLRVRGLAETRREVAVAGMLRTVGLSAFAEAYPYQLSGGMRQRVALARALANDPEVLLMDEPFGALDEQNRILLQEELLRIWDRTDKTVLFVTHSIDEAVVLGDRVLVMTAAPGRIKDEIVVPFPRPREVYALKRDPAFGEMTYRIWQALREEVNAARSSERGS
ncbi:MAG TPA: ABC transporter ATP-binding protein [Ardenticatenaceae bacterium]|nr:ABC transporter ATP-binding protein [Ardenticatenaceae bacterium]